MDANSLVKQYVSLKNAYLLGADITDLKLEEVNFKGATRPDGSLYN